MNYLQRLAAVALNPGGNIHPVVNSRFSTVNDQSGMNSLILEENLFDVVNPLSGERSEQRIDPTLRALEAFANSDAPQAKSPPPISSGFLLPEQPESASTIPFTREPETADPLEQLERSTDAALQREQSPGAKSQRIRSDPLKPAEFRDDAMPAGSVFRQAAGDSRAATAARRRANAANPGQSIREPDEIQIHIGRIEVMAVQAPAPSVTAPRPRKAAPSLEEYLQRRDRRGP